MAIMAATSSTCKASLLTMNWKKQPKHSPTQFLKIPPAEALIGFFVEAPSVFTLIQEAKGGDHMTSLIVRALGGLMLTLQALRILNSSMSQLAVCLVLFPAIEVLAIIKLIADFQ